MNVCRLFVQDENKEGGICKDEQSPRAVNRQPTASLHRRGEWQLPRAYEGYFLTWVIKRFFLIFPVLPR